MGFVFEKRVVFHRPLTQVTMLRFYGPPTTPNAVLHRSVVLLGMRSSIGPSEMSECASNNRCVLQVQIPFRASDHRAVQMVNMCKMYTVQYVYRIQNCLSISLSETGRL